MKRVKRACVFLASLGAFSAALAADTYAIDTVHTQVLFFADHLGLSKSQGEFLKFEGRYRFDPADWSTASVDVTIDTASLSMDDPKWDEHLKSPDFFSVEQHPRMTFRSTRVEQHGENSGRIHGDLTLLGITRPVTLDVRFNKAAEIPTSKKFKSGFSATSKIKRSEWGMKYGLPGIGDEVEIRLEVEGYRQ